MYRFSQRTDGPHLIYKETNDPHYWYAEYEVDNGRDVLACQFKVLTDETGN